MSETWEQKVDGLFEDLRRTLIALRPIGERRPNYEAAKAKIAKFSQSQGTASSLLALTCGQIEQILDALASPTEAPKEIRIGGDRNTDGVTWEDAKQKEMNPVMAAIKAYESFDHQSMPVALNAAFTAFAAAIEQRQSAPEKEPRHDLDSESGEPVGAMPTGENPRPTQMKANLLGSKYSKVHSVEHDYQLGCNYDGGPESPPCQPVEGETIAGTKEYWRGRTKEYSQALDGLRDEISAQERQIAGLEAAWKQQITALMEIKTACDFDSTSATTQDVIKFIQMARAK